MERVTLLANVVLGSAAVCALAALAYLTYKYSWARQGEFASVGGMLLYYGLPALFAGLCFALLRLRPAHRRNAALLLVSTTISIYAVEIALGVWFSLPSVRADMSYSAKAQAAEEAGVPFDTRTKLEVADALRENGVDAYPTGTRQDLLEEQAEGTLRSKISTETEVLPLGWISNKVSVACNETGHFLVYESDEHGFHNPRGLWNGSEIEIVALGDSYTNGFCVPSDKNFAALIRQQHPATLNLGMAGHGPLSILATLKEYGPRVRPRLVLWFHYEGNDFRDLAVERKSPLLRRYLESGATQGLVNRQPDIDRLLIAYVDEVRNTSELSRKIEELGDLLEDPADLQKKAPQVIKLSHVRGQIGLVHGRGADEAARTQRFQGELELLRKTLVEAQGLVRTWGGTVHFVYLPHYDRYTTPAVPEGHWGRHHVLQTVRALGLPIVDIHPVFKAQQDPLSLFPFRRKNHYNERGHRLVAEAVLQHISPR